MDAGKGALNPFDEGIYSVQIERPLVACDLETTDPDASTCAIFEYGAVLLRPDGTSVKFSKRFKPWKPITPEAEEITGVTNAMVENCPPFADYAEKIWKSLRGKDLLGYNIRRFDVVALDQELRRCGFQLDTEGTRIIDPQVIYFKKEERTLSAAVQRFCGRDHEGAHGALPDAAASWDVLLGQRAAFEDVSAMSMDELHAYSIMGDNAPIDLAGKLYRDADGFARFAFGKNKDKRVVDEPGYCRWMVSANFPGSTLDALEVELSKLEL